jgi:hypothetical protein
MELPVFGHRDFLKGLSMTFLLSCVQYVSVPVHSSTMSASSFPELPLAMSNW